MMWQTTHCLLVDESRSFYQNFTTIIIMILPIIMILLRRMQKATISLPLNIACCLKTTVTHLATGATLCVLLCGS